MFKEVFIWTFNFGLDAIAVFAGLIAAALLIIGPIWIIFHLIIDGLPTWAHKLIYFIKEQYEIFMMPKDKRKEYKEIAAQASISEKKRKYEEERERLELLAERQRKRRGF